MLFRSIAIPLVVTTLASSSVALPVAQPQDNGLSGLEASLQSLTSGLLSKLQGEIDSGNATNFTFATTIVETSTSTADSALASALSAGISGLDNSSGSTNSINGNGNVPGSSFDKRGSNFTDFASGSNATAQLTALAAAIQSGKLNGSDPAVINQVFSLIEEQEIQFNNATDVAAEGDEDDEEEEGDDGVTKRAMTKGEKAAKMAAKKAGKKGKMAHKKGKMAGKKAGKKGKMAGKKAAASAASVAAASASVASVAAVAATSVASAAASAATSQAAVAARALRIARNF